MSIFVKTIPIKNIQKGIMKKYKLECYGWEMEALCHSLDNDKAERINKLVEEGQELYEAVNDIEDFDVDIYSPDVFQIVDIYSPDVFQISRGLDNDKIFFKEEELEATDYLDNTHKATSAYLWSGF
jgi:hypothetical protein